MGDSKYCYPGTDVLINKLNIRNQRELFEAEKKLTFVRLQKLQTEPIRGNFDFEHLKAIHEYIFQDVYDWAGQERTVEIGKGNLFCTVACIPSYAKSVFDKYYSQCFSSRNNFDDYVRTFADNYGDLNALHPFREGNGRTQREFARLVCLECGYNFDLSCATHKEMLEASQLNFNKGDSSAFIEIFSKALTPYVEHEYEREPERLKILTIDDLIVGAPENYDYYEYGEYEYTDVFEELYRAKINKMDAEKVISEAKAILQQNRDAIEIQAKEIIEKSKLRERDDDYCR